MIKYVDAHTHHIHEAEGDTLGVFQWMAHESFLEEIGRFFSIGIHPWYIQQWQIEDDFSFVVAKSSLPNCLAVGECGLDALVKTPLKVQERILDWHIDLALQCQKPLIIPCVRAFNELFRLMDHRVQLPKILIHGFNKNSEIAVACIDRGWHLSFGYDLMTYSHLEDVFCLIPIDRILLETDQKIAVLPDLYNHAQKLRPDVDISSALLQNFNKFYFE